MTRRAFGIVEVLIAAVLLGVVLGAIWFVFASGSRATST